MRGKRGRGILEAMLRVGEEGCKRNIRTKRKHKGRRTRGGKRGHSRM